MTNQKPVFKRGQEGAEAAEKMHSGARFPRTEYLHIEDEGQVILRYVTDFPEWIYITQHAGAPTKNPPKDWDKDRKWPESMPAVCRHDKAFEGIYSDCYICDAKLQNQWGRECKPSMRVWALACLREEVIGTQEMADRGDIEPNQIGKRLGYRDAIREVAEKDDKGEPTGKVLEERAIVVVNMAPSNYFDALKSIHGIYGTVCDRDYVVRKSGVKKDTVYTHVPLDPIEGLNPDSDKWQRYLDSVKEQNIDLGEIISERASDDYFAKFFDPDKSVASKGGEQGGSASAPSPASKPEAEVDQDRLASMRERVRRSAMSDVD